MRLKNSELQVLLQIVATHVPTEIYELYLFGSRTDDSKKGGDIDLLLVIATEQKNTLLDKKGRIKSDLSQALGDQRIDLTICDPIQAEREPFLRTALSTACRLK